MANGSFSILPFFISKTSKGDEKSTRTAKIPPSESESESGSVEHNKPLEAPQELPNGEELLEMTTKR